MIYIYNFHVLIHLLLNYICKLHWNSSVAMTAEVTNGRIAMIGIFGIVFAETFFGHPIVQLLGFTQ
jgi:Chlorophyll A-B binding protein